MSQPNLLELEAPIKICGAHARGLARGDLAPANAAQRAWRAWLARRRLAPHTAASLLTPPPPRYSRRRRLATHAAADSLLTPPPTRYSRRRRLATHAAALALLPTPSRQLPACRRHPRPVLGPAAAV